MAGTRGFRFGQSSALLVGDLCHVLADELLCRSGFPPARVLDAFHHFNRMRAETVCGEYLDLAFSVEGCRDEAAIRRMTELKTASYSMVGPLLVGAALAGADDETCSALAEYGRRLGLAFQFNDDVMGLFGDISSTGKDVDADPRKGRQTMLLARGWEMGGPTTRRILETLAAKPEIPAADVGRLRMALEECGALDRTLASVRSLATDAKRALEHLPMEGEVKRALLAVAEWVGSRGDRLPRAGKSDERGLEDGGASTVPGACLPFFESL